MPVTAASCWDISPPGRLRTDFLITHRGPLEQILQGYQTFGERRENCLKWVITRT